MSNFKFFTYFLTAFALLASQLTATAQSQKQIRQITANYKKELLTELATQSAEKAKADRAEAIEYARQRNLPVTRVTDEGNFISLQKVLPDGSLLYYSTFNADASHSTRTDHVNTGGSTGFNLDGENMTAHVWDGGHPRVTHQEYQDGNGQSRVTIEDGPLELHEHAGHVIGTVAAAGVNPQAKGMAPLASVKAYQWDNDISEATAAAQDGMLVSNHSYGYFFLFLPDWMFGAYNEDSRDWDEVMYNAPYYLQVVAAGNDGSFTWWNSSPLQSGYDMLSGHATAKNNLVVANANDANVDSGGNLISVTLEPSSSPGPTDDLRIKPDITGNGSDVFSSVVSSDTAYDTMTGTSMASPNVMGSLLLLQEHYNNINGEFMLAATLKGLALHTADDAGPEGPDAKWGWGLLNTKRAAETISNNGEGALIQQLVLNEGETITMQIESDGITDLMASISWTDLPGTAMDGVTNSPNAILINDLDIRITQGSETYYPWRLTSASANSKDGDNTKDPFERIDIAGASGRYTITITHKGTLETGSQAFSLIVTGIGSNECVATVPENVTVSDITEDSALVSWDAVPEATYDLRYRKTTATGWIEISDITETSYLLTDLETDSQYVVQVRSKCSESEVSEYSSSEVFSLGCAFDIAITVEPITRVALADLDNTSSPTSTIPLEDFTDIIGHPSRGETYTITLEGNTDGAYTNYFTVWIDWNQNGDWSDAGEMYEIGSIYNSNGNDGVQLTGEIAVPEDAVRGNTIMRVIKNFGESPTDPCGIYNYGQAEDYTLLVDDHVGIDDHSKVNFTYYPNPMNDYLHINSTNIVESITVYNMLGQKLINASKLTDNKIDLSGLAQGTYLVRAVFENNQWETFKIIKN